MKRIFVPTTGGGDWQRRLAKPDLHWVPGKSAMSAAACWEGAASQLPPEVSAALESSGDTALAGLSLLLAVPEWEVALPGGATTSCTDIMVFASNANGLAVIAIEAKVDEPFGPTLGEKRRDPSPGQRERLAFLHRELRLEHPLPDDVRYQLLHRTVSAILTARAFHAKIAVMMVQSFSAQCLWLDDFDRFSHALGVGVKPGTAAAVCVHEEPKLFLSWCVGDQRFRESDLRSGV